jgi:eukaryotic-like serine/threonine-protein kinase
LPDSSFLNLNGQEVFLAQGLFMDGSTASHDKLDRSIPVSTGDSAIHQGNSFGAFSGQESNSQNNTPLASTDSNNLRGKAGMDTVIKSGDGPAGVISQSTWAVSDDNSVLMRLFPPIEQSTSTVGQSLDPAGIELAHFRIEERIGQGGMGAVFRALDTKLQRHVALKLLAPSQSHDSASVKRFQNEARAAARLDHENIARVYYIGEENGLHFIAFEFISGSTIRDLIYKRGRLNAHDTVNYALQVAYALNHTSGMGVVHRDIKPSNIIITPKGRSKLVDLGLARKNGSESQGELTLPGSTLGTFDYIAPEQAKDPRSVDVRSDIYSLGCTMFHMLCGEVPYPDGTVLQKLLDHQNKEAPDVGQKCRSIPPALSAIVRKMMNSDRTKRFQTPDQLIKELSKVAGAVGMRGVNPEGLVWVTGKSVQQRTWTSHIGWILTAVCLLSVVVLLEVFPELSRNLTGLNGPPSNDVSTNLSDSREGSGRIEQVPSFASADGTTNKKPFEIKDDSGDKLLDQLKKEPQPNLNANQDPQNIITSPGETSPTTDDGKPKPMPGDPKTQITPAIVGASDDASKTDNNNDSPIDNQARPFIVYAGDGSVKRRYLTLEAAVAELEDGSEIVLDFSGPRTEKPLRLSKSSVTIRAANGKTPVIEFTPTESHSHMISLQAGQVRLLNLQFTMNVPNGATGKHYALFGLSQSSQLSLNRVVATIANPAGAATTSFIDSTHGFGEMPDLKMPGKQVDSMVVEVSESIFRGDGILAQVGFEKRLDLTLSHSAVAISNHMFQFASHTTSMLNGQLALRVDLDHVTSIVDGSIMKFAGPAKIENSSKVEWTARNSVFSSISSTPFVVCDDNVAAEDARRLLSLVTSERNYYNQYDVFWSIVDDDTAFSFMDWRTHWGSVLESRTKNDPVSFKLPIATLQDMASANFALREPTEGKPNTAIQGAANGDNAGCDLARLPIVFVKKNAAATTAEKPTPNSDTRKGTAPKAVKE